MLRLCDPSPTHGRCPFHKLVGVPPGGVVAEAENKPETAVADRETSCSTGLACQKHRDRANAEGSICTGRGTQTRRT
jgi:hypothetical protein